MRKLIVFGMAAAVMLALAVVPGSQVLAGEDVIEIGIQVAPGTILIGADQATNVTVHADIPYGTVDKALSITLNGVDVAFTFADDCGDLVAKFRTTDIKGVVAPGDVVLTLCGTTTSGDEFSGSCVVRVVEFSGTDDPPGKKG